MVKSDHDSISVIYEVHAQPNNNQKIYSILSLIFCFFFTTKLGPFSGLLFFPFEPLVEGPSKLYFTFSLSLINNPRIKRLQLSYTRLSIFSCARFSASSCSCKHNLLILDQTIEEQDVYLFPGSGEYLCIFFTHNKAIKCRMTPARMKIKTYYCRSAVNVEFSSYFVESRY